MGNEPSLPIAYLARHGETAWSLTGQHTGLTDLPLTDRGERNAVALGERLRELRFDAVWCSPLLRARQTCELAGYAGRARIDPELIEWNYGEYEGQTSTAILAKRPDWVLFRDGCPGGESPEAISARADRVVVRLREEAGTALVFSSGHFLRVLASRWLGLEPSMNARYLMLSTASLSAVGYETKMSRPTIRLWNETRHVERSAAT